MMFVYEFVCKSIDRIELEHVAALQANHAEFKAGMILEFSII